MKAVFQTILDPEIPFGPVIPVIARDLLNHIKNLFIDITKSSEKLVITCGSSSIDIETRKKLFLRFKKVEELFGEERYKESFALLKISAKTMIRIILNLDKNEAESTYLENLFPLNQKVGIWWWLLTQAEENLEKSSMEMVKTDILLGLYFISTFRNKK